MAILLSTEFNIPEEDLDQIGLFNVFLDIDSHFFVNIRRLRTTAVPEFIGAYEKVNRYFYDIGLLLKTSCSNKDRTYREAVKRFNFPEVNGINLGFSSGRHGAGFGTMLREKIIKDAHEIIQSGSMQPEIFHLVGLFEENVGPDRLSDMVARIIYDNIIAYSKRVYSELEISASTFPKYKFSEGILINPYKDIELLLLPLDILHELPIARCWDDIDRVCRENDAIRAEINSLATGEWIKMVSSERKRYLREWVFKNPERAGRIVDSYRTTTVDTYDPLSDIDYLVGYMHNTFAVTTEKNASSFETSLDIVDNYREWVEYHRGASIIQSASSRAKEKTVQRTLHAVALMYCAKFNWDISPEVDSGRGPVDFKISRGTDKTVIEIKLTSNAECVHGLEIQIEEYAMSEKTTNKLFILVNTGQNEGRVLTVLKKHEEMLKAGLNPARVIIIEAKEKASASTFQPV